MFLTTSREKNCQTLFPGLRTECSVLQEEGGKKGKAKIPEKSMFHGKEERDNLGRSWMDPPKEQRSEVEQAFLPKRWIHTWSGHTKGVNAIR